MPFVHASLINTFVERMEAAADAQEYELAARFRDQISKLKEIEARGWRPS